MPPADLRALRDAVVAVMPELRARSAEAHYGYPVVENPHDFDPDLECCTPEEIANHKAACEAWDRGERDVRPHMCGNAAVNGWGIGAQTIHDEALMAALALADAISPEVVEAWETLMRLGEWRRAHPTLSESQNHWPYELMRQVGAIADRLAAEESKP